MFFNCVNININLIPNRMCDECTNKESVIIMNIRGNDLYLCKDCYEKLHNEMSNLLENLNTKGIGYYKDLEKKMKIQIAKNQGYSDEQIKEMFYD